MIAQLDRRIGDVMAKLKEAGIDDNTLVIFTSDNGGAWYNGMSDLNAPFRGWKANFFEGGLRAPLFMRWPGGIAAGTPRTDVTGDRTRGVEGKSVSGRVDLGGRGGRKKKKD